MKERGKAHPASLANILLCATFQVKEIASRKCLPLKAFFLACWKHLKI